MGWRKVGRLPFAPLAMVAACVLLAAVRPAVALYPREVAVPIEAVTSDTPPVITLYWTQQKPSDTVAQHLYRRAKDGTAADWVELPVTLTQTSYADMTAAAGVPYEYEIVTTASGTQYPSTPTAAQGHLCAGSRIAAVRDRGTMVLVVDDVTSAGLAPEVRQTTRDLLGDGWRVERLTVARAEPTTSVHSKIQAIYNTDPTNVRCVYLLGRVPVPYSGSIAPDGHGGHIGAWPADGYYGDMDGTWTDTSVNSTSADDPRNRNIPHDGKFDQSYFPGSNGVELQVGRADLAKMTQAPSSGATEQDLMRRYMTKAHAYKHRMAPYDDIPRRSIVRDGFGNYGSGSTPFATTGFRTAYVFCGRSDSLIDTPTQLFPAIGQRKYLWGYGCGAGGYTGANTCSDSYAFGTQPSKAVFTALFGSFLGDWDSSNNFMRAPLAGNASGDGLGLCCFWAGRPGWFLQHMALGENLGYTARVAMNNSNTFESPDYGARMVHIALMGDPSLRLYMPLPPQALRGTSASGQVTLHWDASTDDAVLGYVVYRADSPAGPFALLTAGRIAQTTYTDATGAAGQTYTYMVRTEKLETSPAGTFENSSQGSFVTVSVAPATGAPANPTGLTAANTGSGPVALAWRDNASDETGYRIERRDGPAAAFAVIGGAAANATSFSDPGPLAAGTVYYYRVVATGTAGDSAPSDEAMLFASAGFLDLTNTHMFVSKQNGTAQIPFERYGGAVGAVAARYATADGSAVAGVHYTAVSGSQTWADGGEGFQPIVVPLANTSQFSLPRSFRLSDSNPTSGSYLTGHTATTAVIVDTQAVLAWPWKEATDTTDRAPGVSAEGVIGSTMYGGSFGSNTENVHFMYNSFAGDGSMTVRVPAPVPAQTRSVYGIMVRENLNMWEAFAALRLAGDTSGSKFVYRTNKQDWAAPTTTPTANNTDKAPYWLRMTRSGTYFTAETSADGSVWSTLSVTSVTLPTTALWGVFHQSDPYGSDYQLATFDVTATPWPTPPAPTTTTLTSADVAPGGAVNHAVNFTVTFSEAMSQFDPSEIVVTNGTPSGSFSLATVGTTFAFSVTPTTAGLVTVSVPAGAAVATAAPNAVNNYSFPRPNYSFTYDPIRPVIAVDAVVPALRAQPVTSVTVHFSKAVVDFGVGSLVFWRNSVPMALTGVSVVDLGGGTDWSIQGLGPLTGAPGEYLIGVDASLVHDALGNPCAAHAWTTWINAVKNPAEWSVF